MKTDGWEDHESSHIVRSKYNSMDRTLDIEYKNGSVYRSHGVPPSEHQSFLSAKSQGEYHAANLKENYHVERIK